MSKRFAAPLAAVLALAAPSALPQPKAPNCKPPRCVVTVVVGGNSCAGGIHVSKDPIILPLNQQVDIVWNIPQEVDWDFDGVNGVKLNPSTQAPFNVLKEALAPKSYVMRVSPTNEARTYKYDINLKKGGQACSLDPVIMTN